jgi:CRISPR/Cas system-associated exonuclease Cas4 (RecB family)
MLKTYSFSALKLYEQCPAKYKFSRIDRLEEPTGKAAERGKQIHSQLEGVLKREIELSDDTPEITYLSTNIAKWQEQNAQSEMLIAVGADWTSAEYDDPTALFRGIIDLYFEEDAVATVTDYKTGKLRDYSDQLEVYSTLVMTNKPHIEKVTPIIEFIDHKRTMQHAIIHRAKLPVLQDKLVGRLEVLDKDQTHVPNPSYLCKFCHFRKENGGPCQW